ncbi:MAG: hypothetical protein AB7N76_06880 [Planctomycetota bacterium]
MLADAARYRAMTPEERAHHLDLACRLAAKALAADPEGERIAAWEEPPHASYREIVTRLRRDRSFD